MYTPIFTIAMLDANQRAELIRHSALFDEEWYREQYPHIEYHPDGNPDPAYHYANYGYRDCQPSVLFDGQRYLKEQGLTDVNPLLHCLSQGESTLPYRISWALEEAMAKYAFGLNLKPSERLLLAEHSFNLRRRNPVDLTQRPLNLEQQLFVYEALHATKLPQGQALNQLLRERAVKEEFISDPITTVPVEKMSILNSEGLKWSELPQSMRLNICGMFQHQLIISNKEQQVGEVLNFVHEVNNATVHQHLLQPFNPEYHGPYSALIYGPEDPIVQGTLATIKQKGTMLLHQIEFWCAQGQVLCALSHQSPAVTVFDSQGKMLPYAFALEGDNFRPINAQHEKMERFEELSGEALKVAGDAPFMAVTYLLVPNANVYVLTNISALPYGGNFSFTQDFSIRLAQKAKLPL